MSLFGLIKRLLAFSAWVACPAALLGVVFGGARGAATAAATAIVASFLSSFRAERAIRSIYRVRAESPDGPRRSLARVIAVGIATGDRMPRIFSFSDPAPQALVARSFGGPGSILVSEGLLGALSEQELRELLESAVLRLRSRGIRFQTFCAWIAHRVLEWAPRPWVELMFGELRWHESLGVWGAIRFVIVLAASRVLTSLGSTPRVEAPRALMRLPVVSGEVANPGSRFLHFRDPWAPRGLLN